MYFEDASKIEISLKYLLIASANIYCSFYFIRKNIEDGIGRFVT
jgi:hypothetical protein